jgi:hypothetical protein
MKEDSRYAPDLFNKERPPEGILPYPTQSRKTPSNTTFAGEYRGYYGADEFTPYSSHFGKVRNNKTKNHGGVDIYAPYIPFPHETPVYAVCAGAIEFIYNNERPDDLGNRAWLYPEHTPKERLIYGHLNRFVGTDRRVARGDLIGFSGCSGNADSRGECTTAGNFHINSGHVHLAYRDAAAKPVEPLAKLGWTLRFAEEEKIPLDKWIADGHLLDTPPAPGFAPGALRTDTRRNERVGKATAPGKAVVAGRTDLFGVIDFDNSKAIKQTAHFYALAHARLSETELDHPKARFHTFGWEALKESIGDASDAVLRLQKINEKLHGIGQEPENNGTLADRIRRSQTLSAEYLLHAIRFLWLAMAGKAMVPVAKNPGTVLDEKTGKAVALPGSKEHGAGRVPACGIGMSGRSILVSLGRGDAALHLSALHKIVPDPKDAKKTILVPFSSWTISTSFGAGTAWHAVLDASFQTGLTDASPELLKAYARTLPWAAQGLAYVGRGLCNGGAIADEQGLKRFLQSMPSFMGMFSGEQEQPGAAIELLGVLKKIAASKDISVALLKLIAKTSAAATLQALKCFDPKAEQLPRIRSAYDLVWIET